MEIILKNMNLKFWVFLRGLVFCKKITIYQSRLIESYLFPRGKNGVEQNKNFESAKNKLNKINYKK